MCLEYSLFILLLSDALVLLKTSFTIVISANGSALCNPDLQMGKYMTSR